MRNQLLLIGAIISFIVLASMCIFSMLYGIELLSSSSLLIACYYLLIRLLSEDNTEVIQKSTNKARLFYTKSDSSLKWFDCRYLTREQVDANRALIADYLANNNL